jgi:hypothetical protein
MRNRAFLGQVPLRYAGFGSLGQTVNRYIPDPNAPVPFQPFTPGQTREEYERNEYFLPQIAKKQAECNALKMALDDIDERYFVQDIGTYQEYTDAYDAYQKCVNETNILINDMEYGTTPIPPPEWPQEVPQPLEKWWEQWETPEELPPPVASVDLRTQQTPVEQPQTPEWMKPIPTPEPVASVDWRFAGCPAGTQRIVRGGACVAPGLISTALNTPTTTITPSTAATPMTATSSLLQGRSIPVKPLYAGRF